MTRTVFVNQQDYVVEAAWSRRNGDLAGRDEPPLRRAGRPPRPRATEFGARGGRRVCHGAPATSAPVDHACRTGWTVRPPCDGGHGAGGGGAEPVPLEGGLGERPGLAAAVLGRLVEQASNAGARQRCQGTDNIRAEIHSKGSAQPPGGSRAGRWARETGGVGKPARFWVDRARGRGPSRVAAARLTPYG